MNKIYITFVVALILINSNISFAINPDECDFFKGLQCTASLTLAINNCKENKDISKCYNELQENKECINCTCNLFSDYCSDKTGEIDPNGATNPFSKIKTHEKDTKYIDIKKILLAAVKCDPNLFETCQEKAKKIGGKCLSESKKSPLDCVKEELSKTECKTCLCKVIPSMCDKEELEKAEKSNKKSHSSSPNITEFLLGGIMQSGLNNEGMKKMMNDGVSKDNLNKLLQNKDVQNKLKDLFNNPQIKDQLKNLVSSNPEEIAKIVQNLAENKSAVKAVQDIAEASVKKEKERFQTEKKQQFQEEKAKNKLECNNQMKKKCQFEFIKLLKQCPVSEGQKACVYTKLSGNDCEVCICTFIKNIC